MTTSSENGRGRELIGMQTPPVVSAEEWKAAWEELHVKEKVHSRARDALAADRRRLPWLAVKKDPDEPEGSAGDEAMVGQRLGAGGAVNETG